jgi:selenocysteine lyase/cysteine desulfurase
MLNRRAFLHHGAGVLGAGALLTHVNGLAEVAAASAAVADRTAEEVAQDELYWGQIQGAFSLDRSLINLNNGANCPSPRVVHEAFKRYMDIANQAPAHHRVGIEGNLETARRRLAAEFGCDPEELAITRGASESLQIAQNGLDLAPGDEILTTEQDYGRMLTTWDQRVERDGIKVNRINFPVPASQDDLFNRLQAALTPRTRVLHICHVTNLTGQLFPVRRLSRLARERNVLTIVDGAHGFAHFPYKVADLECDYYGTSLHKWLLAPAGTGFLYVRREHIEKTWPLQAAPSVRKGNIRKFEEIGAHPVGARAAINEALAFHHAIGVERKAARLRYLTLRWANRLKAIPRVQIHTSLEPGQVWGVATVGIRDLDTRRLAQFLWDTRRIVTASIIRDDYQGLRITPNVYTTLEEIDTFAAAMEEAAKKGVDA